MKPSTSTPRWQKWEFWPFWFFYIPVYFKIIIDSIRFRSFSYFTLANPGMKMGGFSSYSKFDILRQLDSKYLPRSVLLDQQTTRQQVLEHMLHESISFPIILKPDAGERGWKVEKINDENELDEYLLDSPGELIMQEYITLPEEYGVMYFRFPSDKTGFVSSVMKREFLSVAGDGKSTLLDLMLSSERCRYHLPRMKKKHADQLHFILQDGEKKILEEIGNHNRGTTFLNANHLINDQLVNAFNEASRTLNEWYFGRFDLRTLSYEEMLKGNFKVVEVNGVNSEPAHIYDPHMNLFTAYGDLFSHWNTIYKISKENRKRGFRPDKTGDAWQIINEHLREKKEHPNKV